MCGHKRARRDGPRNAGIHTNNTFICVCMCDKCSDMLTLNYINPEQAKKVMVMAMLMLNVVGFLELYYPHRLSPRSHRKTV